MDLLKCEIVSNYNNLIKISLWLISAIFSLRNAHFCNPFLPNYSRNQ